MPLSPVTAAFARQNFLRCQNNKTNYNLVCETLQFLDIMCGSTTGGLGLLGLYINEYNVALITQTLETLTEYCQGPCHENQVWGYLCGSGGISAGLGVSLWVWGISLLSRDARGRILGGMRGKAAETGPAFGFWGVNRSRTWAAEDARVHRGAARFVSYGLAR